VREQRPDGINQHVLGLIHIVVKRLDNVLDERRDVMGGTPWDTVAWILET
jgi:hypothetical protein